MHIVTTGILKDEPCWGLTEGSALLPNPEGGTHHRWVQRVFVVRGDTIAKYETDYGPAENFSHIQPLMIPSFGENRVADLQELADKNRNDDYWAKRRAEMLAESTMIADVIRQDEEMKLQARNKSVIGPYFRRERNLYSQEAGRQILKEKLRGN